MKKVGGIYCGYENELLAACKITVKITDEYQKSLDSKKDRKMCVSEYYAFAEKLRECVSLADQTAKKVSERIEQADKINDFTAEDTFNKLLEHYFYYRTNVEYFLKITEAAKSSDDFLRVLNHESDVLARKTIVIKDQI